MIKKCLFVSLLFFSVSVYAGTVRLVNDSAFKLRAMIRAADGTLLGEMTVPAQQTMSWNDYWGGVSAYNQSRTPYSVTWSCAEGGGDFSVSNNVPTGATTTAMGGLGPRMCQPKKPNNNAKQDAASPDTSGDSSDSDAMYGPP